MKRLFYLSLLFLTPVLSHAMGYIPDQDISAEKFEPKTSKRHKYFKNSSEISLTNTSGNTNVQTYIFKTENVYRFKDHRFIFGGHYTYGEANSLLNEQNWDINLSYLKRLDRTWSLLVAESMEGNKFQQVQRRYNTDFGSKVFFYNKKRTRLSLLTAYRYTNEQRYDEGAILQNKGRVLLEFSMKPNKRTELKASADYIPNFTQSIDWNFVGEMSIKTSLTDIFALKFGYKYMIDNLPAESNLEKKDSILTTSLVLDFD